MSMRKKDSSILGIEFHESEIRVIQLRSRQSQPDLEKMGRIAMPIGSMQNGYIIAPEVVSEALKSLLESMDVKCTRAVIGLAGECTNVRTIDVPPVCDEELAVIVSGEVVDLNMTHGDQGAHAYIRMSKQSQLEIGDGWRDQTEVWMGTSSHKAKPELVTVFATQHAAILCIRQVVEGAGLTVEAIEPTHYAMYRSMLKTAGSLTTFFGLMVGPANTDIAVVHQGELVAYRRIDIGSRVITSDIVPSNDFAYLGPSVEEYANEPSEAKSVPSNLNRLSLEAFTTEIHRTLYYYQREYPSLSDCERVLIAVDDGRLETLADELASRLGLTVEPIRPLSGSLDRPVAGTSFTNRFDIVCSTAFGLAMHGQSLSRVPRIDLYSVERVAEEKVVSIRNFRGSILTSALAVAVGVAGCALYQNQIAQLDREALMTNTQASQVRKAINTVVEDRHRQADQYKAFRKTGIPVTEILDSIAGSVGPGTGLSSVAVSPNQQVVIDGESASESSMLVTIKTLQECPLLTDLHINWFRQVAPEKGTGISFELHGKTITSDRIRMHEETKK